MSDSVAPKRGVECLAESPAGKRLCTQQEETDEKAAHDRPRRFKVCVCGAAGGIGQPLSLLLAMDPRVAELSVYDLNIAMVPAKGVAADLGHVEMPAKVVGYEKALGEKGKDVLGDCLRGCSLVLVPAGMPRKPGQTRDDLFKVNADIAKDVIEACARHCPTAVVALVVNPVNSVVPAMAELYRKIGLNPLNIVGVTTLDCVRANKFVALATGADPVDVDVPVIGGHAGTTILPLFSQDKYGKTVAAADIPDLDKAVQNAGTVVVEAKNGKGSATLSMAYAGARLAKKILSGLSGEPATECAYVNTNTQPGVEYFASQVTFGKIGVQKVHKMAGLTAYENSRLQDLLPILQGEIKTGLDYAARNDLAF